jgi:RNA polymerase sigma-70 factor (ECF subfamily)
MRDVEGDRRVPMLRGTPFEKVDDRNLVQAVIARDPRAQRELWRRYAPLVSRVLRRMLGRNHDTDDLAQEIFLCVFEKMPVLRDPKALRAFIISVAMLTSRCERRRLAARSRAEVSKNHGVSSKTIILPETDAREAVRRFYSILDRVNAQNRALFVFRYIEELKLPEIADICGISVATTKRRLARAWSKVRLLVERDPVLAELVPNRSDNHAELP